MHEESLTHKGRELFPHLAHFDDFYLVGGSALALHIGHRVSVDFDMFSPDPLPKNILTLVHRAFGRAIPIAVTYDDPGQQLNLVIDGVKATFFSYAYPVLDPLVTHQNVRIACIREIAAMKAFAIGQRMAFKDYVDWYFMLKEHHVNLAEVIAHANKKFGPEFNDRLFLGQLASLEDIREQPIEFLRGKVTYNSIKAFLAQSVKKFSGM